MTLEAFVSSSKSLLNRMRRQGVNSKRIGRTLRKMYNKHSVLQNFGENAFGQMFVEIIILSCPELSF